MTSLTVGTPIPPLERKIDITDMVAYAGATWDWHRLHYDMDYIRSTGFGAPIVDGQMLGALMAQCVQDWAGPDARLTKLGFRFLTPVEAGSVVRCEGVTVSVESGVLKCDLTAHILDAEGRVVGTAATGSAEVKLT
jgi:acyl dehydratase